MLYGLYEGVPLPQRGGFMPPPIPDRIFIFRGPLSRAYRTPHALREQIAVTVLHEVGHHFGIDDDRLHELGDDIPRALDVPSLRTGISAMTVALMAYLAKGARGSPVVPAAVSEAPTTVGKRSARVSSRSGTTRLCVGSDAARPTSRSCWP